MRIRRVHAGHPARGPRPGRDPGGRRRCGPAARRAAGRRRPCSARIASMSRTPTGPRRSRAQRDRIVGRSGSSASAQSTIVTPGRRLLERLEQGRLGVLVHAVGTLDDRDPGAALDRQQGQVGDEVADAPDLGAGAADDDLATRARPARAGAGRGGRRARRAGTPGRSRHGRAAASSAVHSRPAARSSASVVLPTPAGPTSRTACGRPAADHRGDRGERGRVPPGPSAVHDDRSVRSRAVVLPGRPAACGAASACGVARRRRSRRPARSSTRRSPALRRGPSLRRRLRRPAVGRRRGRRPRRRVAWAPPRTRRTARSSRSSPCRRWTIASSAAWRVPLRSVGVGRSARVGGDRLGTAAPLDSSLARPGTVSVGRVGGPGSPAREASPRARAAPRSRARPIPSLASRRGLGARGSRMAGSRAAPHRQHHRRRRSGR